MRVMKEREESEQDCESQAIGNVTLVSRGRIDCGGERGALTRVGPLSFSLGRLLWLQQELVSETINGRQVTRCEY